MDRGSSFAVPYGCACTTCSHAKVKCTIRPGSMRCERCLRLNKECHPSATIRQRRPRKKLVSKTARVEEKLDNILGLLQTGAILPDINHHPATVVPESTNPISSDLNSYMPTATQLTPETNSLDSPSDHSSASSVREFALTLAQAEEYLTAFKNQKSKYFPFIYIPATTTAEQLRLQRPFLYTCIMAISSQITVQQQALNLKVKELIALHMLHEPMQSGLDMLLGILAYIGWSKCVGSKVPKLSVSTQLATSLVFELGLNNPPRNDTALTCYDVLQCEPASSTPTVRTMEERRAVLGCFLITSIISSFLHKIDALRWTQHMDQCLQVLDENQECNNDQILVQQVRLQLIVEQTKPRNWHYTPGFTKAPLEFYVHALQSRLEEIKKRPDSNSNQYGNDIIMAHFYSTSLAIHQIALTDMPITANSTDWQQLDSLCACLNSAKSWFDVFLSIPPKACVDFPFSIVSQLMHCLVTLYRLSILEDPAWDTAKARNRVDALSILDQIINNITQTIAQIGLRSDGEVLSRAHKMLISMKAKWEARLGSNHMEPTVLNTGEPLINSFPLDFADDDDWMRILLSTWND
ncbi:Zn(II)2Cys6 transcription factor [Lipomyces kononenkoae]|uniref:Zn(II)2Cys6 transcription factor n=1 Tax=Lipomyces kononenkoae TaxID=34357 RepID=A0ACC3SVS2_LIPKO